MKLEKGATTPTASPDVESSSDDIQFMNTEQIGSAFKSEL
jgi:hypothetical protein